MTDDKPTYVYNFLGMESYSVTSDTALPSGKSTVKLDFAIEDKKKLGSGGVLSTSTGLVFQGGLDGNLTAFDSETGKTLWQFNTGAGVTAPPIAFTLDGEDFIAVAAGGSSVWTFPKGDTVLVFGLPKRWEPKAKK